MTLLLVLAKKVRKNLSAREIRYLFSRYILARIPGLNRYYSLYSRLINVDKLPGAELSIENIVSTLELSVEEKEYLSSAAHKSSYTLTKQGLRLAYAFSAYGADRCDILSQSMAIIQRDSETVALCPGSPLNRNVVRPYHYRTVTHQPGVAISMLMTPSGHSHYFHFLLDQYIVLRYLLELVPESRTATILVRRDLRPFQQAAFDILKQMYPDISFRGVATGEKVQCDRLLFSCRNFADFIELFADAAKLKQIGEDFREHYGLNTATHLGTPTRIVISRNNQKLRRLVNEDALMEQLTPLGFVLIRPEDLSHGQQVALFSSAEVIVASSGAALTNIVFCRPGGILIELGLMGIHMPFWFALARQIGWQHKFIGCQFLDAHDSHEVDVTNAVEIIQSALASNR